MDDRADEALTSEGLPAWLSLEPPPRPTPSAEQKALVIRQYEVAFPIILNRIYEGYTLATALKQYPTRIDVGAFTRWMRKDPGRLSMYKEAKEVRSEAWTGLMLKHALGEDEDGEPIPTELDRSKTVIDALKWLISRENRKEYGDTKTIEMNTTISITAALEQAHARVISATVIDEDDVDLLDEQDVKRLAQAEHRHDPEDGDEDE